MSTDPNPNTPSQVALWSAANANLFQNNLATAAIQAAKNGDGTPAFPNFSNTAIPFGSTINVTNPAPIASGGKLAQAVLAGLAAMGIGSGAISLLKANPPSAMTPSVSSAASNVPVAPQAPAVPTSPTVPLGPPASAPAAPVTIEGTLNWELTPDGGISTSVDSGTDGLRAPVPDAIVQGQAMFVAAQHAFLAGQQAKAAAANDAAVGSDSTVTNVNIVLDPDLSSLYNTAGVEPPFKANIAALQCVRYLQSVQTTLAQILAAVAPAPPANQTPTPATTPAPVQPTIKTQSTPVL